MKDEHDHSPSLLQDDSTLTGRLKRYVGLSSAVGGIALRAVGEKYLGFTPADEATQAAALTATLGRLKGPFMKIAQFLATVPGALPSEYANQLMALQTDAPSMGWPFVRRRMATELGPDWQTRFASFSPTACAAASLGQVHEAYALDGTHLACKLQYPDMAATIDADLTQLKVALGLYEQWGKALDTQGLQAEIAARLREELDYTQEARNISDYADIFAHHPRIMVPSVDPDLSTARLLTLSWAEGTSILTYTDAPQDIRDDLGALLFEAWYKPLYHHGIVHGDPHPGNYKVTRDRQLILLDFGCVRRFEKPFLAGVVALYRALQKNDRDAAVNALTQWGFTNLNNAVIDVIIEWAKLLYDPLLDDKIRPIQYQLDGQASWETATKVHEELRRLGGINPPREFVFMDRAAVGIGAVLMRLRSQQNWYQIFEALIDGHF